MKILNKIMIISLLLFMMGAVDAAPGDVNYCNDPGVAEVLNSTIICIGGNGSGTIIDNINVTYDNDTTTINTYDNDSFYQVLDIFNNSGIIYNVSTNGSNNIIVTNGSLTFYNWTIDNSSFHNSGIINSTVLNSTLDNTVLIGDTILNSTCNNTAILNSNLSVGNTSLSVGDSFVYVNQSGDNISIHTGNQTHTINVTNPVNITIGQENITIQTGNISISSPIENNLNTTINENITVNLGNTSTIINQTFNSPTSINISSNDSFEIWAGNTTINASYLIPVNLTLGNESITINTGNQTHIINISAPVNVSIGENITIQTGDINITTPIDNYLNTTIQNYDNITVNTGSVFMNLSTSNPVNITDYDNTTITTGPINITIQEDINTSLSITGDIINITDNNNNSFSLNTTIQSPVNVSIGPSNTTVTTGPVNVTIGPTDSRTWVNITDNSTIQVWTGNTSISSPVNLTNNLNITVQPDSTIINMGNSSTTINNTIQSPVNVTVNETINVQIGQANITIEPQSINTTLNITSNNNFTIHTGNISTAINTTIPIDVIINETFEVHLGNTTIQSHFNVTSWINVTGDNITIEEGNLTVTIGDTNNYVNVTMAPVTVQTGNITLNMTSNNPNNITINDAGVWVGSTSINTSVNITDNNNVGINETTTIFNNFTVINEAPTPIGSSEIQIIITNRSYNPTNGEVKTTWAATFTNYSYPVALYLEVEGYTVDAVIIDSPGTFYLNGTIKEGFEGKISGYLITGNGTVENRFYIWVEPAPPADIVRDFWINADWLLETALVGWSSYTTVNLDYVYPLIYLFIVLVIWRTIREGIHAWKVKYTLTKREAKQHYDFEQLGE